MQADLYTNEPEDYLAQSQEKSGIFDYLLGTYIVAMLATNFSVHNDLLSNIGMALPVLLLLSLFVSRYHFQREFFALIGLYLWILLGSLMAEYRLLSLGSAFYFWKVQFIMLIVALRCNNFRRMRFYLISCALGAGFLVVTSALSSSYMAYTERQVGTVGEANSLGAITATAFISWLCLLFMVSGRLKMIFWIVCAVMGVISVYVLVSTASRGGFLTVVCFIAVGGWYIWRQSRRAVKLLLPAVSLVALLLILNVTKELMIMRRLAGFLWALGVPEVPGMSIGVGTDISRLIILEQALDIFYRFPVLGAGYGTFRAYTTVVYTHTTPFDFLYSTGAVGTLLYHFVIVSGWRVLAKAKKLGKYDPEIRRNICICQALIIAQLVAGMSLPTQVSKFQAVLSGVWLGVVWYMRSWMKEQSAYDTEMEFAADSEAIHST